MPRLSFALSAIAAVALLAGCKTANQAADTVKDAGSTVAHSAGEALGGAVSLVNVDLSNVLNDLSLDLKIDKANIPINAQIPISVAANVCGVSINILSIGGGGGSPNCTANSTSPELEQAVQQQLAANGSVGGGSQATSGTSASGATTTPSGTAAPTTPAPAPTGTTSTDSTTTTTPTSGQ
jgi:hypothetical protein